MECMEHVNRRLAYNHTCTRCSLYSGRDCTETTTCRLVFSMEHAEQFRRAYPSNGALSAQTAHTPQCPCAQRCALTEWWSMWIILSVYPRHKVHAAYSVRIPRHQCAYSVHNATRSIYIDMEHILLYTYTSTDYIKRSFLRGNMAHTGCREHTPLRICRVPKTCQAIFMSVLRCGLLTSHTCCTARSEPSSRRGSCSMTTKRHSHVELVLAEAGCLFSCLPPEVLITK
jgi:hypothetical protein